MHAGRHSRRVQRCLATCSRPSQSPAGTLHWEVRLDNAVTDVELVGGLIIAATNVGEVLQIDARDGASLARTRSGSTAGRPCCCHQPPRETAGSGASTWTAAPPSSTCSPTCEGMHTPTDPEVTARCGDVPTGSCTTGRNLPIVQSSQQRVAQSALHVDKGCCRDERRFHKLSDAANLAQRTLHASHKRLVMRPGRACRCVMAHGAAAHVFAKWLAGYRLTCLPWAGQGWHEDTRASLFVGQVRLSVVPRKVRGIKRVSGDGTSGDAEQRVRPGSPQRHHQWCQERPRYRGTHGGPRACWNRTRNCVRGASIPS